MTSANSEHFEITSFCNDFEVLAHLGIAYDDASGYSSSDVVVVFTVHPSFVCTSHSNGVSVHLWCTPAAVAQMNPPH